MKYCTNCGKELKEEADVCLNCGKFINNRVPKPVTNKQNKSDAKSIISLILGIIAIFWTLIMLIGIESGITTLVEEYSYEQGTAYFIGYYIGYTLFALAPGIVSMILGFLQNKGQKSNMATAGIVLSGISLVFCLFVLIRFIMVIY